ncbi:unnamed protein product [Effrenium voratum]|uniref:J domain-containing protein n=1 Tax=Effrenium voratum TaxID=2562239 RepID=A0AA36HQ71_9DINO|nr:unnamed protein product [Effrenium voratum]
MFDFEELSECEDTASSETRAPSGPDPAELRARCEGRGLCITWGPDVPQMEAMLREVEDWDKYGICALKEECLKRRIPVDPIVERPDVLSRLYDVVVWQQMSLKQLQSECWRRRIPFVSSRRVSQLLLLETENPHADAEKDLVTRLMQDVFPGKSGPLPVGGISGVWTPGAGSYAGGTRVPAWTGAVAPGFERRHRSPPKTAPAGPPPKAKATVPPKQDDRPKTEAPSREKAKFKFEPGQARAFVDPCEEVPKEYYQTLGLQPGASNQEVRRAYRQLALKCHPDKSKELEGTRFKELTAAYKALCDLHDC